MSNRLALIKSRFAVLRGNASVNSVDAFHPTPAGRHAGTCGGVKFYSNPTVLPDEPLSADFVPAAVEEYRSLLSEGLNAAELAAVDMESAAVAFESDFDSFPADFSPDAADPAPTVASVAPKVIEKRGPLPIKVSEEVAEIAPAGLCDEFEFLRQRVLAMARS